ncbi:MAG: hypothetical protein H8E62_06780 [Planctomycetes bacterium]|nr:hypothetical protein [Planctomycetota bacterium]
MKITLYILMVIASAATGFTQVQHAWSENGMTGPRLSLNYHPDSPEQSNPVECFMYFVPLTSLTSVTIATSPETTFSADITSQKTEQHGKTVRVQCNFEITGNGNYVTSYNPEEMIKNKLSQKKNPREVTNLLESIRITGSCKGRIEGIGKVDGDAIQMERVEVSFNRDNTESPVEISMYDIPKQNGQFLYENRTNCQVARINSLTFKQDKKGKPGMSVEIASLKKAKKKEGVFSKLTAMVANILLTSIPVDPVGNATMMDFSTALYEKKPVFVFPYADNIKTQHVSKL